MHYHVKDRMKVVAHPPMTNPWAKYGGIHISILNSMVVTCDRNKDAFPMNYNVWFKVHEFFAYLYKNHVKSNIFMNDKV